jgi:hypothetical protein
MRGGEVETKEQSAKIQTALLIVLGKWWTLV